MVGYPKKPGVYKSRSEKQIATGKRTSPALPPVRIRFYTADLGREPWFAPLASPGNNIFTSSKYMTTFSVRGILYGSLLGRRLSV
jgi:hypothetical protein